MKKIFYLLSCITLMAFASCGKKYPAADFYLGRIFISDSLPAYFYDLATGDGYEIKNNDISQLLLKEIGGAAPEDFIVKTRGVLDLGSDQNLNLIEVVSYELAPASEFSGRDLMLSAQYMGGEDFFMEMRLDYTYTIVRKPVDGPQETIEEGSWGLASEKLLILTDKSHGNKQSSYYVKTEDTTGLISNEKKSFIFVPFAPVYPSSNTNTGTGSDTSGDTAGSSPAKDI